MIKKEFVKLYATHNMITDLKKARDEVENFLDTLKLALADNKQVIFRNFGSFEVRTTKARNVVDPKNSNEIIKAKPRKYVKFKVSKKIENDLANV